MTTKTQMRWTLFTADPEQPTLDITNRESLVAIVIDGVDIEMSAAEARHTAGALLYAANMADGAGADGAYRTVTTAHGGAMTNQGNDE